MKNLLLLLAVYGGCVVLVSADLLATFNQVVQVTDELAGFSQHVRAKRSAKKLSAESDEDSEKQDSSSSSSSSASSSEEDDDNNNGMCTAHCLQTMNDRLQYAFPEFNLTSKGGLHGKYTSQLVDEYDPEKFDEFCHVYRNASSCIHSCDDIMTEFALKLLGPVETMCITEFESYKRNLPCINKVDKKLADTCNKTCQDYEEYLQSLLDLAADENTMRQMITTEDRKLKSIFKGTCLYLSCQLNCTLPTTEAECGSEASALVKSTIASSFSTVNDLMQMFKQQSFWPSECAVLATLS